MDGRCYSLGLRWLLVVVVLAAAGASAVKLSRLDAAQPPTPLWPCFSVYRLDTNESRVYRHVGTADNGDCVYTFEAPEDAVLDLQVLNVRLPAKGYGYQCGPHAVRVFDFRPDGTLEPLATWCGWPGSPAPLTSRSSRNLALVTSTVAPGAFDLRVSAVAAPPADDIAQPLVEQLRPPPPPTDASSGGDATRDTSEAAEMEPTPTAAAALVEADAETTPSTAASTTSTTTTTEGARVQETSSTAPATPPRGADNQTFSEDRINASSTSQALAPLPAQSEETSDGNTKILPAQNISAAEHSPN